MPEMNFTLRVPGSTSNLGPGFDVLGLALQKYLTLTVRGPVDEPRLSLAGEGSDSLPADATNLVVRSYHEGCRAAGCRPRALELHIENDIPVARGLGSSGAARIAGLLLAQRLCGHDRLPDARLLALAASAEGHSENVTASLAGGFSASVLRDQTVVYAHLSFPQQLRAVALIPDFEVETEKARDLLPASLPFEQVVENLQFLGLFIAGMQQADWHALAAGSDDHVHQPWRKTLIPGYDAITLAARRAGAHSTFISGSGSTIIALADKKTAAIADAMAAAAHPYGYGFRCEILAVDHDGAQFL